MISLNKRNWVLQTSLICSSGFLLTALSCNPGTYRYFIEPDEQKTTVVLIVPDLSQEQIIQVVGEWMGSRNQSRSTTQNLHSNLNYAETDTDKDLAFKIVETSQGMPQTCFHYVEQKWAFLILENIDNEFCIQGIPARKIYALWFKSPEGKYESAKQAFADLKTYLSETWGDRKVRYGNIHMSRRSKTQP